MVETGVAKGKSDKSPGVNGQRLDAKELAFGSIAGFVGRKMMANTGIEPVTPAMSRPGLQPSSMGFQ